jgi:hypothetical protein
MKRLSVEDRLQVQDLVVSYVTLLDLAQFDALAGLFLPTGVLELPEKRLQGIGEIRAHFQNESIQAQHRDRLHHADSVAVGSRDWDCIVRSHYFETERGSGREECVLCASGVFEDLIVHCTEGWKFSTRKFSPAGRRPAS